MFAKPIPEFTHACSERPVSHCYGVSGIITAEKPTKQSVEIFFCHLYKLKGRLKTMSSIRLADAVADKEGVDGGIAAAETAIEFGRVFGAAAHEDIGAE